MTTIRKNLWLLIGVGLLVPTSYVCAVDAPPAPPPPPSFNTEAPVSPDAPAAPIIGGGDDGIVNESGWSQKDLLKADEQSEQTKADQKLFDPELTGAEPDMNMPAAPMISEEQIIENAFTVAYQLYHAEDYGACARATKVILDKYPKRKLYWIEYLRALSLEHSELYLEAIKHYQKVIKQRPRTTYANSAMFRVAMCYSKLNEFIEGIYVLRDIIDTHPRSEYRLQAYIHLGNMYRRDGQWKAVVRTYKELIRLYPDTMWAYTGGLYLAEAYMHMGKHNKAVRIYRNLQRAPTTPEHFKAQAQLRIGDIFMAKEEWQKALTEYRVALRNYETVTGIPLYADQKIAEAQLARDIHRQPYQKQRGPRVIDRDPIDSSYRMKQQGE